MFAIKLISCDGAHAATGQIPFAPVPGIFLKVPWENNDYHRVDEVYFDHISKQFEVFVVGNA